MFHEYQVVKLKKHLPEHNLAKGVRGAVLFVYEEKSNLPRAYEVEFVDNQGKTLAQLTIFEDDIEEDDEMGK